MSEQTTGITEPLSISDLDLREANLLSTSVLRVYNELLEILIHFAGRASATPVESTHQLRKKLKFFRAFVKLLKPYHSTEDLKQANFVLRDFGRQFSDLRDAHVRGLMIEEFRNEAIFRQADSYIQRLDKHNRQEISQIEPTLFEPRNRFLQFSSELEQSKILMNYFHLDHPKPKSVLNSFKDSFQKSALAFQNAFQSDDPSLMHEWRKRLKDVQYQFELLLANLPDQLRTSYNFVVVLCDNLGRYNDLDMFHHWLAQFHQEAYVSNQSITLKFIELQMDELYEEIKHRGENLYKKLPFEP